MQALVIAKDLEGALLEKQFSPIRSSASPELYSVLTDIASETDSHRKTVSEALEAAGKGE